jgi:hypothetical protein
MFILRQHHERAFAEASLNDFYRRASENLRAWASRVLPGSTPPVDDPVLRVWHAQAREYGLRGERQIMRYFKGAQLLSARNIPTAHSLAAHDVLRDRTLAAEVRSALFLEILNMNAPAETNKPFEQEDTKQF